MIQKNSILNVVDNSGAKKVLCIQVLFGYRKRYGYVGDILTVSVKNMRKKRRMSSKVKKGNVVRAIVVRSKSNIKDSFNERLSFNENSVVLITKQFKLIGTRIFGAVPAFFRKTKFLRIASLASGIS